MKPWCPIVHLVFYCMLQHFEITEQRFISDHAWCLHMQCPCVCIISVDLITMTIDKVKTINKSAMEAFTSICFLDMPCELWITKTYVLLSQVMLMVLELLGNKNCTVPVTLLRYSDAKLGPFYTQEQVLYTVQLLTRLLPWQIPREQVKVLDHPKLQVFILSPCLHNCTCSENMWSTLIHFIGWISWEMGPWAISRTYHGTYPTVGHRHGSSYFFETLWTSKYSGFLFS